MLALVLAATIDAQALMAHVATIADATMTIRQERQLTYFKILTKDDETKEWVGWWDGTGQHDQLIKVDGRRVRRAPEPSTDLDLSEIMRTRFDFTMADPPETTGPECDHRPCYAVNFTLKSAEDRAKLPKLGDPKAEMIVNNLTGTLYVDQEHLFLVHIRGREAGSFNHPNGLATIKQIKLDYHQKLFGIIPVLEWSKIDVQYTVSASLLKWISGTDRTHYTYTDYTFAYPPAP